MRPLVQALRRAGLMYLLSSGQPCTFLVPENAALLQLAEIDPASPLTLSSPLGMEAVASHVIKGVALSPTDVVEGTPCMFTASSGLPLIISKRGSALRASTGVYSAAMSLPEQFGSAIIYTLDHVLASPAVTPAKAALLAPPPVQDVVQDLGLAVEALRCSGVNLWSVQPKTIFVPVSGAIAKYHAIDPQGVRILQTAAGADCINTHVVEGERIMVSDIPQGGGGNYTSKTGQTILITRMGPASIVTCGDRTAQIITPDLNFGTCVVHTVSDVLAPIAVATRALAASPITVMEELKWSFGTVTSAGVDPTRDVCTIFAPTDTALAKFMESESNSPEIPALLPTSAGAKVVDAHCITGQALSINDFPEGCTNYISKAGTRISVHRRGAEVRASSQSVDGVERSAQVVSADLKFGDSIIHSIDGTLEKLSGSLLT